MYDVVATGVNLLFNHGVIIHYKGVKNQILENLKALNRSSYSKSKKSPYGSYAQTCVNPVLTNVRPYGFMLHLD